MRRQLSFNIFIVTILLVSSTTYSKSFEEESTTLVTNLVRQLVAKERKRVATLDFTDIQGRPNELGRYLADQLAVDLVAVKGLAVLDRANINSIMAEHQLTTEGLVKPENAKKLGQFAGVDAILIGTVAVMESDAILTVKAISTETSEVVAAGRVRFSMTKDIQKMLNTNLSGTSRASSSRTSPSSSSGPVSSGDVETIATRDIGPVTAILRNVMTYMIHSENGSNPGIRCAFDIENRDLQRSVVIAANGLIVPVIPDKDNRTNSLVQTRGFQARLTDSESTAWFSPLNGGLLGISYVYCFEIQPVYGGFFYTQNSPGSIVKYIKSGKLYPFSTERDSCPEGRYWAGSFTVIPPGKSLQLTVAFAPNAVNPESGNQNSSRRRSSAFTPPSVQHFQSESQRSLERQATVAIPEYFQFDMELVLGTILEGEEPEKSKDLTVRNLTIDKIVLPKTSGTSKP